MIFRDRLIIGASITISLIVATVGLSVALQLPDRSGERTFCLEGFKVSEAALGPRVNLEEAQAGFNSSFSLPSRLPRGTTLDRLYIAESEDLLRLFYSSPRIQSFCYPGGDTEIEIDISRYVSDGYPFQGNVVVCGLAGLAYEPSDSPSRNGKLSWSSDDLHYTIRSRIPVNQLLRIANSMC